jgi:hypothetical protein
MKKLAEVPSILMKSIIRWIKYKCLLTMLGEKV